MITQFKIFEVWNSDGLLEELIDQIDYEIISNVYGKNFNASTSEIIDSAPDLVIQCFKFDEWREDFIKGSIETKELSEFSSDEYTNYINNHMTDDKKEKILELYNKANNDDDDVVSEIKGTVSFITTPKDRIKRIIITSEDNEIKEYKNPKEYNVVVDNGDIVNVGSVLSTAGKTEYDDDMLEELDDWDLREIIEDSSEVGEFIEESVRSSYETEDGRDMFDELYSNLSGKKIFKLFPNFIDVDKMKMKFSQGESDDHKISQVKYLIPTNKTLQRYLIKKDKDNTDKLLDVWLSNNTDKKYTIGEEYKFQKKYIKWYFNENKDDSDEEYNAELISDALYYLNNKFNFVIDFNIQEEYKEHMWKVNGKKYNL